MYSKIKPCTYMTGKTEIVPPTYTFVNNSTLESHEHAHSFIEIVYFNSGQGTHRINGKEFNISSGDVFLINANTTHSYSIIDPEKEVCVKNCIFLADKFNLPANDFIKTFYFKLFNEKLPFETANFIYVNGDYKKEIYNLLQIIEDELKLKHRHYEEIVDNVLYSILIKIFRSYEQKNNNQYISTENITVLEDAIAYLKTHYHENITLIELSKNFNFSKNYFNLIFKRYTSMTFKKYIQKLRCDKACELLESTNYTIENICETVGYSDPKQFFYIFKEIVGITPGAYRKQATTYNKKI